MWPCTEYYSTVHCASNIAFYPSTLRALISKYPDNLSRMVSTTTGWPQAAKLTARFSIVYSVLPTPYAVHTPSP